MTFGRHFGGLLDLIDMPKERRFLGPPDGSPDFSALTQHIGPPSDPEGRHGAPAPVTDVPRGRPMLLHIRIRLTTSMGPRR